jgi:hypothetical protein
MRKLIFVFFFCWIILLGTHSQGAPIIVGSVNLNGYVNRVFIHESYAYTTVGRSLQIIDITNPVNPEVVGSIGLSWDSNWHSDVHISGDYAYWTESGSNYSIFKVVDITNPNSLSIVGSLDTLGKARQIYVSGSYAYVAGGEQNGGLIIIDVSDPFNPFIANSIETPSDTFDVNVSGNYAYVAFNHGFQVVDISDPTNPSTEGVYYHYDLDPKYLDVSGAYAYMNDNSYGLQVFDITDPNNPVIIGSVEGAHDNDLRVSDGYVYTTNGDGLKVIDINDPTNPIMVDSLNTEGYSIGIDVFGSYAYIADGNYGLKVVDITDFVQFDDCPNDSDKTKPGVCGCGTPDTDTDNDFVPDCVDNCPNDPNKINPGICGCDVADTDSDLDGTPDCNDNCDSNLDTDNDGVGDCDESCPNDPDKTDPGVCGCGLADTDTDNDGIPDCIDFQLIANITSPVSNQKINVGKSVNFQCSVLGGNPPFTYLWNFDGGANNSTQRDPGDVTFSEVGTYNVKLAAADDDGDIDSDTVTITVKEESDGGGGGGGGFCFVGTLP